MMTRPRPVLSVLGSIFLAACSGSDRPSRSPAAGPAPIGPDVAADVDALGERSVDQDGIVGLSIAIARDGKLVYSRGFGHADVARTAPVTPATMFDIASVGKHFTAVAILDLVERGRLRLDQKVRDFVPALPAQFPNATIDQLLRHTSGFVDGPFDEQAPPDDYQRKRYGLELLTDIHLRTGKAAFEPGETWSYSNSGYLVLGLVVERASGLRYDRALRRALLDRLGLGALTVLERGPAPRMSQSIRRTVQGVAEVAYIDMTAYGGQGSICSSAPDLLRWWGALNRGQIIDRASLEQLRRPSPVGGQAEVPYGMAQRLGGLEGHAKVGHTGTFDGGSAALAFYPADDLEIAVLSNTHGNGVPHAHMIETEIARRILGVIHPDVRSLRRPITATEKCAIEGDYHSGGSSVFTARVEGDELVVLNNGEKVSRLLHVGGLRFRSVDNPLVHESFLMDGERAGWWIYNLSGNYLDVLRRRPAAARPCREPSQPGR